MTHSADFLIVFMSFAGYQHSISMFCPENSLLYRQTPVWFDVIFCIGWKPGNNILYNVKGVFRAGIITGYNQFICISGYGTAHFTAFSTVTVATGTKYRNELAGSLFFQR